MGVFQGFFQLLQGMVQLRGGAGWGYTAGTPDMHPIRTRLHAANPRDDHSALLISRLQP